MSISKQDINTATFEQICAPKGIGRETASKIKLLQPTIYSFSILKDRIPERIIKLLRINL